MDFYVDSIRVQSYSGWAFLFTNIVLMLRAYNKRNKVMKKLIEAKT